MSRSIVSSPMWATHPSHSLRTPSKASPSPPSASKGITVFGGGAHISSLVRPISLLTASFAWPRGRAMLSPSLRLATFPRAAASLRIASSDASSMFRVGMWPCATSSSGLGPLPLLLLPASAVKMA